MKKERNLREKLKSMIFRTNWAWKSFLLKIKKPLK